MDAICKRGKKILWHKRLRHTSYSKLSNLSTKNLVRGLPNIKFDKDYPIPKYKTLNSNSCPPLG